jgi:hypothetical protein
MLGLAREVQGLQSAAGLRGEQFKVDYGPCPLHGSYRDFIGRTLNRIADPNPEDPGTNEERKDKRTKERRTQ